MRNKAAIDLPKKTLTITTIVTDWMESIITVNKRDAENTGETIDRSGYKKEEIRKHEEISTASFISDCVDWEESKGTASRECSREEGEGREVEREEEESIK
jgi:hypothetical protein